MLLIDTALAAAAYSAEIIQRHRLVRGTITRVFPWNDYKPSHKYIGYPPKPVFMGLGTPQGD
jgi:hypothetical protein